MSALVAQYIAGAVILIALFLLLSDPQGTSDIFKSLASGNAQVINALQGQGAPKRR